MKFEPINTTQNFEFGLDPYYDKMNEIIIKASEDISKKREDQIIEALKNRGYEFQNKEQLYEFAKRCTVISYDYNNQKELWYEKELVCMWDETVSTIKENDKITSMFTIRVG